MISIGLAPLPNTSCTAAGTTSLKDGFGIITKIFTSIENRDLLRALKKIRHNKEKVPNTRIKMTKKLILL